MRGDGRGGFLPVTPTESGLIIDGEGRGVAVADLDHDGRPDLVAAQNRGATRVFLNRQGRPSLRLRVQGVAANPAAIGASVRPVFETGRMGPRQEWHAGSGYWSQDAAELLVPLAHTPKAFEVRWPGGKTSIHAVEAGKTELLLVQPGP